MVFELQVMQKRAIIALSKSVFFVTSFVKLREKAEKKKKKPLFLIELIKY